MYKWASIAHSLQYQTIQWPPKYITAQKEEMGFLQHLMKKI